MPLSVRSNSSGNSDFFFGHLSHITGFWKKKLYISYSNTPTLPDVDSVVIFDALRMLDTSVLCDGIIHTWIADNVRVGHLHCGPNHSRSVGDYQEPVTLDISEE